MIAFSRTDNSVLSRWWWTVDRWMLALVLALAGVGIWLTLTASPAVAERLGLDAMHFVKRQAVFMTLGLGTVFVVSLMSATMVRRMAVIGLPVMLVLMLATLVIGPEIKGATRWLQIGSYTLQPSEFMKPFFIVSTAWVLSSHFSDEKIPAKQVALGLYLLVVSLLILQPDFGQTILISTVWFAQMALAGLPMMWMVLTGCVGVLGLGVGYALLPHVASRIDRFINPASGDTYQTDKAMEAFEAGGMLGKGPGEGAVKLHLPDAHTDYIFAVVGEEFGAIACVLLLVLFAGIVVRGLAHLLEEENPFRLLAAAGLIMQFGLQTLINVGVNLALLPSKGMTLPFISYGGSSMLALAIGMGMMLALTKRNRFIRPGSDPMGWRAAE
ncbi:MULTISPECIES: putative lipid II flippase FtsW [Kordiimonas]|jgi:cell division protein FtsW|uniref:Probable peptidoglycan glycosyltransferase FtsW n=1 Tax=Kordiimonas lacus TaxID=637679 RepID=A0A1G7DLQ6_9PROT|nr:MULTISPECIES: putative lipid II flippase FtsW [Kordiimonas]SDE52010.1 cell division protein FtsW [Kordiimonas lacus]